MDPITLGLILSAVGTGVNAGTSYLNQRSANKETKRRQGIAEPWLQGMLGGGGSEQFNAGQDALMQMLRSNPMEASNRSMTEMVNTGNPFDTTELFRSLGVMDERARGDALAGVRAGSSGLGQRFGTAMARESNNTMAQLLEGAAARNAQIAMGSHESAQGRKLGAASQLGQNQSLMAGLAQMLMGSDAQQQNQQLNALSLLLGMPMGQSAATGVGSDIGSMGQMLAFMEMMRGAQRGTS